MKYVFKSPMGYIYYEMKDDYLTSMYISQEDEGITKHHVKVNQELNAYFNGTLKRFSIPISFTKGTDFQKEVWSALFTVPFGMTKSYKDIAEQIQRPKALRAIGQACKKNPIGIIVPCHRIIGSDGSMTGYSGKAYIYLKEKLLAHERGVIHD